MFKYTLLVVLGAPLIAMANTRMDISSQDIKSFTRKGEKVGDYEPIEAAQVFSPGNACVVDKDGSFAGKLKQCKKQRVGWLKI